MAERSIRSRLRILVLGVALPLVALAGGSIWTDYASSLRRAQDQTRREAEVVATAAHQYVRSAMEIAAELAASAALRSLEADRCLGALTPVVDAVPQVTNLLVTLPDRTLVCSVLELPDSLGRPDTAPRPWVQQAIDDGVPQVSPPIMGRISGVPVVVIAYPIRVEGVSRAVLQMPLGVAEFQALLERPIPEDWLLTIADTGQIVLARSEDPAEWVMRALPTPEDPEERVDLSVDQGFNTTEGADGLRRLFAYERIAGTPWFAWAGAPTSVIFAPARATLYPKLALAALALLFTSVFAGVTRKRVGSALDGLMRRMAEVDATPHGLVAEEGPEEIAEVARRYNNLLRTRRAAEAAAAASADLNEIVMRATNDALWDWHLESDQIEVNGRFVELFGPHAGAGVVDFWMSRVHPGDAPEMEARIQSLRGPERVTWSAEYRMRRVDGTWAEVLERCYALRDETGEVVRVLGAIMDVTEARRERRATEKAKERYRSVLRNAAFGVCISTLDGQLVVVNPALLRMIGVGSDEALAMNEADFYLDPAERAREVADVVKRREVGPLETTWRTAGGAVLNVRLFRTMFIDESGDVALEVIAEDLTERTRLEEQFRQAQKMEAVGQLAGGVAHDFNNRLTVIQGRAQLVRTEVGHDPELLENVDAILESVAGAARLTRELLAVSRKQLFKPELLSLSDVVSRLSRTLSTLLGEPYRLEVEAEEPDLPLVLADPGHLQQILMNLLVNARDAQPGGGVIRIRTSRHRVSEREARTRLDVEAGEYVAMAVIDTGTGMQPEVAERAYEPFFTTKPVGVGTGLGLATVHGLVSQNAGYVTLDSRVGAGTEVRIHLPVATGEADAPAVRRPDTAVPRGNGASVLVVEDEQGVRAVVARTLSVLDYEVHVAESAVEALALPDDTLGGLAVLVSDIVMPDMRGTELADRLQEKYPELPVLFISGYRHDAALDLSASRRRDFLAKPFSPQALGLAVARLIGDERSPDG